MSRHRPALLATVALVLAALALPAPAQAQLGALRDAARRKIQKQLEGDTAKPAPVRAPGSGAPNAAPAAAPASAVQPLGGITAADVDLFVRVNTAVDAEYEKIRPAIEYTNTTTMALRNDAITECRLGAFAASRGVNADSLHRLLLAKRLGHGGSGIVDDLDHQFSEREFSTGNAKLAACMDRAPTLASFAPRLRGAAATVQSLGVAANVEAKPVIGTDDPEISKSMGGPTDFQLMVDPIALNAAVSRRLADVEQRELGPQWDARRFGQLREYIWAALAPSRAAQALPRFDASGREALERNRAAITRLGFDTRR